MRPFEFIPRFLIILMIMPLLTACARPAVEEADRTDPEHVTEEPDRDRTEQQPGPMEAGDLEALYREASTWYDITQKEKDLSYLWDEEERRASVVREDLVSGVQVVTGMWRVLVVSDLDRPDAPFTRPYLATLTERVRNAELRVAGASDNHDLVERVDRGTGAALFLLDENHDPVACRPLRPQALLELTGERFETLPADPPALFLVDWYLGNRDRIQVELMNLIRNAEEGETDCAIRFE